jgi:tetratricopeptide (TPR) repeat protein
MSGCGHKFARVATLLAALASIGWAQPAIQFQTASPACQQAEARRGDGKLRAAAKDYPGAIEDLRAALELCPESQAMARERFPEAGRTLQALLAQDDRSPDAHKLLGLTLFFYKEYVTSERELLTALRQRPGDQEALYYLGRVYYTQNNFPPAVTAFRKLLEEDPTSYKGYDNLGLCYEAQEKTEEAVRAFKRAQELARAAEPGYDWPYANLAALMIKENRDEEALPSARQAVRINPRSARNHYLLGKVLSRRDDLPASAEQLRKAAELDPDYPEPHYLLGQLYQRLGHRADAEREFTLFEKTSKQKKEPAVKAEK